MNKLSLFIFILTSSILFPQSAADTLSLVDKAKIIPLSKKLNEISGIVYTSTGLWAFNDSGGDPAIYRLNLHTGKINQTVWIENAKNIDWEDIAADQNYIYIGDIGNNKGDRENLRIYKVRQADIKSNKKNQKVKAEIIKFYFPEQKTYETQEDKITNFDAETLVVINNKLYLLTKEWSSDSATQYEINTSTNEKQAAKLVQKIDTEGAITGGDAIGNDLFLTGYTKDGLIIGWHMKLGKKNEILEKNKKVYGLSVQVGQVEAITYHGGLFYIASEEFKYYSFYVPPRMYIFSKSMILKD